MHIPSLQLFDTIVVDIKEEPSSWDVIQTWEPYLVETYKSTEYNRVCVIRH